MAVKLFGKVLYLAQENKWSLSDVPPHVSIQLKSLFKNIPVHSVPPYNIDATDKNTADIEWFLLRYPMDITPSDKQFLQYKKRRYNKSINDLETIFLKKYKPRKVELKKPHKARPYQLAAKDLLYKKKKLLIGDEFGLGKTLTSILLMLEKGTLPCIVVCETHLQQQWAEQILMFTNLAFHKVKGTTPYVLPEVDVYIVKYSCISGWVNVFAQKSFKYAVFDECQALRRPGSDRYSAAKNICKEMTYISFLSATPIYNYGDEIFWILNCMEEGCLGVYNDFSREWGDKIIRDPNALGSFLRDEFLLLRRTRKEVGQQLPEINKIVFEVDYDEDAVKSEEDLLKKLAYTVINSNDFMEKGSASRELDLRLRQLTGVSKAKSVAAFVKMIVESGEKVVLGVWHREVYNIIQGCFNAYGVTWCMYSGSESPSEKEKSKKEFINGETKVMMMSLRSGAGTDGLQHICSYVVFAELDWSPKVHDQFTARVDRPGNEKQTTAVYVTSEYGSDPVMIDLLGLKSSQAHGIIDPMLEVADQYRDESRIMAMAKRILETEKPAKI